MVIFPASASLCYKLIPSKNLLSYGLTIYDGDIHVTAYFLGYQMCVYIALKKAFGCLMSFKIDFGKILEFFTQMSYGRRFTHLPGSPKQKRLPHRVFFPNPQFFVYISIDIFFHH